MKKPLLFPQSNRDAPQHQWRDAPAVNGLRQTPVMRAILDGRLSASAAPLLPERQKGIPVGTQVFQNLVDGIARHFPNGLSARTPEMTRPEASSGVRHQVAVTSLLELLHAKAPPKPDCFPSRDTWIRWLHAAESSADIKVVKRVGRTGPGERNRGRIKLKELNDGINYCADCTASYETEMRRAGRCSRQVTT